MRLAAYTAPAYDLIEPAERARLTSADPRSIVHLTLPTFGAEDAAARLAAWRADGTFTVESAAALYVYDLAGPGPEPSTRGWVGAVALAPPTVVAPHEATVAAVVADRRALRAATHADLEPVVFAHGGPPGPAAALAEQIVAARPPDADLTDDVGVRHRLWRVADPAELATVRADLARRHGVIADGHHRWAAATRPPDSGHPGDSPAAARQAAVSGAAVAPARTATAGDAAGRPGSGGGESGGGESRGGESGGGESRGGESGGGESGGGESGGGESGGATSSGAGSGGVTPGGAGSGGAASSVAGSARAASPDAVACGAAGLGAGSAGGKGSGGAGSAGGEGSGGIGSAAAADAAAGRVLALVVPAGEHGPQVRAIHRVLPRTTLDRLDVRRFRSAEVGPLTAAGAEELLAAAAAPLVLATDGERWRQLTEPDVAAVTPAAWRELPVGLVDVLLVGERAVVLRHSVAAAVDEARRSGGVALLVPATPTATVLDLAARGVLMPRKSTFFVPKPRTGLVLRCFADQP